MPRQKKQNKNIDNLSILDKAVKGIFSNIDSSYNNKNAIYGRDQRIRSILDRELDISKGVSQGSIIDFVASLKQEGSHGKKEGVSPDSSDLFTKNINNIFSYFQDVYKNHYLEEADLKFISKFIPALGEAVRTTLDEIVASDTVSDTINRKIDLPSSVPESIQNTIRAEINRNEKELKLLQKLRNVVYKNALIGGTYYVYAVSYERIFKEYEKIQSKKEDKSHGINNSKSQFENSKSKLANESYTLGDVNISTAMESVRSMITGGLSASGKKMTTQEVNTIVKNCYDEMPSITCDFSDVYGEALESAETYIQNYDIVQEAKKSKQEDETLNPLTMTTDGTIGTDEKPMNVPGTYIKYIKAKNIVPVKIFDQTVGYFLVHPKARNNKSSVGKTTGITSLGSTLFSAVNVAESKKSEAVDTIVSSISDGILDNFSKKFVTKHVEYKQLIAECIIANGLTDQDFNIQFIPADDIIEFKVSENEDGYGESILSDSLFSAKLLLSMIVARMLNYINKTGNKTIAHISKGPTGVYTSNQIDRVVRDLQEENVTFNDLLSPNLVFNKFNRFGNIALPRAQNGDRLVEFEQQDGQNIDMSPEYETKLENMTILGTGVPSVIMEYTGSIDFAKQIVSANIKYAQRVSLLQADLEGPTTRLYQKIIANSTLTDDIKSICYQSLQIQLPRPQAITNGNGADAMRSAVEEAESIADVYLGRESVTNTDIYKNGTRIKEDMMLRIVKKKSPFINWDDIDKIAQKSMAKYATMPLESDQDTTDSSGGGGF